MEFKFWLENVKKYFSKLNSHNMADTFPEKLMICPMPTEGKQKKKKKKKPKRRKQFLGVKNALII